LVPFREGSAAAKTVVGNRAAAAVAVDKKAARVHCCDSDLPEVGTEFPESEDTAPTIITIISAERIQ